MISLEIRKEISDRLVRGDQERIVQTLKKRGHQVHKSSLSRWFAGKWLTLRINELIVVEACWEVIYTRETQVKQINELARKINASTREAAAIAATQ